VSANGLAVCSYQCNPSDVFERSGGRINWVRSNLYGPKCAVVNNRALLHPRGLCRKEHSQGRNRSSFLSPWVGKRCAFPLKELRTKERGQQPQANSEAAARELAFSRIRRKGLPFQRSPREQKHGVTGLPQVQKPCSMRCRLQVSQRSSCDPTDCDRRRRSVPPLWGRRLDGLLRGKTP
jgi:hypothetical protein